MASAKAGRNQGYYYGQQQQQLVPQQQDTASHLSPGGIPSSIDNYQPLVTGSEAAQSNSNTAVSNKSVTLDERVQVYVRVRPLFKHELLENIQSQQMVRNLQVSPSPAKSNFTELDDDDSNNGSDSGGNRSGCVRFTPNQPQMLTLDMRPKEPRKDFVFRSIFKPESSQLEVFEKTALPLVMHVLNGYNGTYFVYGQTGTGKTHSMGVLSQIDSKSKGIVPQSLEFIFSSLEELQNECLISDWKVHISFFQIYLEQVSDLLNPESKNMSIREEHGEVFVGDLVEVPVTTLDQAMNIVNAGLIHRQMASQAMNDTSSRSHTVLHIDVYQTRHKQDGSNQVEYLKGRLVLVDLAGSERVNKTHSKGIRFEEAKHINSSLTTLGNVISCLANPVNKKHSTRGGSVLSRDSNSTTNTFIPYRSSKLTRILTNSLSYDSKIVLLATLGPAHSSFHESQGTLSFAQRCQDIILKPKMHLETEQESPAAILERLTQHIAEMEEKHKSELNRMQEEINLRENHIQVLELQLTKVQKHLQDQDQTTDNPAALTQTQSYRALQVADMTTFMAKLLQKLTEMSCTLANQFIADSNELLREQDKKGGNVESRINQEIPVDYMKPFEINNEEDTLTFESNTQLLTDDSLDVASLVTQLQNLAKKHNSSLNMLGQQSKAAIKLRVRANKLEKEVNYSQGHLRKSLKDNAEILLNEIVRLHRSPPEQPKYLQQLLQQLSDLDNDFLNHFFQRARNASKHEYQLAETSYQERNPNMLASFPQQNLKVLQQHKQNHLVQAQPQQDLAKHSSKGVEGQSTINPLKASIATSHDPKPNKSVSQTMSPALSGQRGRNASDQRSIGRQSSLNRPQIGAVLHRHPLHVDRSGVNDTKSTTQSQRTEHKSMGVPSTSYPQKSTESQLHEHSFASIVKTQQQVSKASEQDKKAGPHTQDHQPHQQTTRYQESDEVDESLRAYADELAREGVQEETKKAQKYSSVERPSDHLLAPERLVKHQRKGRENSMDMHIAEGKNRSRQASGRTDKYDTSLSRKTGGSRRSIATANSTAHQQCRMDNLVLISKGMQERVFNEFEDFFLK